MLSLIISLVGILILLILSNSIQLKEIPIKNITEKELNKKVQIKGELISIKNYNNFQIISLKDETGEIEAIINKNLNLTKNQKIILTGTVQQYKNSLQIQADKVMLMS